MSAEIKGRDGLKADLKEAAEKSARVFNAAKNRLLKYGTMTMAFLGLHSMAASTNKDTPDDDDKKAIATLVMNSQELKKDSTMRIEEATTRQDFTLRLNDSLRIDSAFVKSYEDMVKEKGSNLTISEMLEKNVTKEDFQTVYENHPELFSGITPSQQISKLTRSMTTSQKPHGNCLGAFQIKMGGELSGILDKNSTCWGNLPMVDGYRSGGDAHLPLEESGKFLVVEMENEAYQNPSKNNEMRKKINKFPTGTIVTMDRTIENIHGMSYKARARFNPGQKHGHIAILGKKNVATGNRDWYSDGVQRYDGTSRYGKKCHACLHKDNQVSPELGAYLLQIAHERQQQQENSKTIDFMEVAMNMNNYRSN